MSNPDDGLTDICNLTHVCSRCKKDTKCMTYFWACPWLNDDEDQMCDDCLDIVQTEMELDMEDDN